MFLFPGVGVFVRKNSTLVGNRNRVNFIEGSNVTLTVADDGDEIDVTIASAGGGGGEANTASNVGTGSGWFKTKTGVDLEFKSLVLASSKLSVVSNINDLTLDVVEANLTIGNLGGSVATSKIDNDAVTYAKIQNVATDRLLGRDTAGSGDVEELTVGGGVEFTGSGGLQRSALTGDVTASAGSNTTTIANDAVTFAKMQNISTDKLIGRDAASSGDPTEIGLSTGLEFNGSDAIRVTANQRIRPICCYLDGGGSAISTGAKAFVYVPFSGTITGWTILADVSGSIVVDVWKDTYANFPPTVADTIAGSEKPTLSSAQKNQDLSLSTWTTSITAGDILRFNVDSASTVTQVFLILLVDCS